MKIIILILILLLTGCIGLRPEEINACQIFCIKHNMSFDYAAVSGLHSEYLHCVCETFTERMLPK